MKINRLLSVLSLSATFGIGSVLPARADDPPMEQSFQAPHEMKMNVKMIGLVAQTTDLQIVCVFKHKPAATR